MKRNFYSDNVSGAAPAILAALNAANAGDAAPYGNDSYSERMARRFAEVFETEVDVLPVGTGTAANGLCAALLTEPFGAVYCADVAHLHTTECGAAEFWSGGRARSVPLPTVDGKVRPADLAAALELAAIRPADVPPRGLSLTQGTEAGTVYTLAEVRALAEVARAAKLRVHMDGARLANALARLQCAPAELTWKAGVDLLSFGATKNGALTADAVVVFDRDLARTLRYRRRQGGHHYSKARFLAVQLEACLAGGLWLDNARHANAMATRVREGLAAIPGVSFAHPTEINLVLLRLPRPVREGLEAEGYSFSRRGGPADGIVRIACAFDTPPEAVDALIEAAGRHAGIAHEWRQPAAAAAR